MIRQANHEDLSNISKVHIMCFPDSFSTALGKFGNGYLLKRYYKEYLDKVPELFLVDEEDGKIVGFCMGYYCETNNFQKDYLKHNLLPIAMRCIGLFFTFNKLFFKKITSIFGKLDAREIIDYSYRNENNTKKGDLLSICVLKEYRNRHIASTLIENFESILKHNNRCYCQLTVKQDNISAIRFYEKENYKKWSCVENSNIGYYKKLVE